MTVKDLISILNELDNHDATVEFLYEHYMEIDSIKEPPDSANIYTIRLK